MTSSEQTGKSVAIIFGVGLAICLLAIIGCLTFVLCTWIIEWTPV